jgi:hypothetical protein
MDTRVENGIHFQEGEDESYHCFNSRIFSRSVPSLLETRHPGGTEAIVGLSVPSYNTPEMSLCLT